MSQNSDEHVAEAIGLTWQIFQDETAKGLDRVTAEENAMRAVFPEEDDLLGLLATWKVKGLWPPEHPDFGHPGLCSNHAHDSGSEASGSQSQDMPSEWMDSISGLVRTTVNAAILDYHNVQGDQVTQEIDLIKSRMVELRQSLEALQSVDKEEIAGLARMAALEALRQAVHERPEAPDFSAIEPSPGTSVGPGQRIAGRHKLEATCNPALLELLHRECTRWGFTVDQMLDHILLDFFRRASDVLSPARTHSTDTGSRINK